MVTFGQSLEDGGDPKSKNETALNEQSDLSLRRP